MRIDWENRTIKVFDETISFDTARAEAILYLEDFVQSHRVKANGLKTTIDWRSVFYSDRFQRLLIFLYL
jgi:hypothetical protein